MRQVSDLVSCLAHLVWDSVKVYQVLRRSSVLSKSAKIVRSLRPNDVEDLAFEGCGSKDLDQVGEWCCDAR